MEDNGTFCMLAWESLGMNTHGRVRACGRSTPNIDNPSLKNVSIGEAWNSNYYKKLRLDMLNGIKNSNCIKCYKEEVLGGTSKRQSFNKRYKSNMNYYSDITDNTGSIKNMPSQLDVRVGNICNLKCTHCWTGNSSKWFEDKLMLNKYENTEKFNIDNSWIDSNSKVWDYLKQHISSIKKLNFLGGEPFANKHHNNFIKWCAENNKDNVEINYVSNGTLITDELIEVLASFRVLSLGISLDAVTDRAEFLRYPTNWKHLDERLTKLNKSFYKTQIYINYTAHALNILHLPETRDYCQDRYPNIRFNLGDHVITPKHMSVQNLPSNYKQIIYDKFAQYSEFRFYAEYMMQDDIWKDNNEILLNYLNDLDQTRKTNWRQILPEIAELYE